LTMCMCMCVCVRAVALSSHRPSTQVPASEFKKGNETFLLSNLRTARYEGLWDVLKYR
jgi:hypothetical protein